eukprot:TRINITY_DN415_c0_g1_i2.p1 TRINITY_DN415_c0_g1~~TRINITY_DN415_c0_g1_i2.p1  ORF type:complete len:173 (+),score=44.51 TRINITY_DN415_c0_g1_i2:151-669(+)
MIVFKDLFTDSELLSDAYKVIDADTHYFMESKYVQRSAGGIDESLIGANASAEESSDQMQEGTTNGLDFVLDNRLIEAFYEKKDFHKELKGYLKRLQAKLFEGKDGSDELKEFQKRAATFFKEMMGQFNDLNVFYGEHDQEFEGTCCFVKFSDDGKKADVWVFKDGVKKEKF